MLATIKGLPGVTKPLMHDHYCATCSTVVVSVGGGCTLSGDPIQHYGHVAHSDTQFEDAALAGRLCENCVVGVKFNIEAITGDDGCWTVIPSGSRYVFDEVDQPSLNGPMLGDDVVCDQVLPILLNEHVFYSDALIDCSLQCLICLDFDDGCWEQQGAIKIC